MPTLTNVNKPRILILDSNATPQDITGNATSRTVQKINPLRLAVACCNRINAYFEIAHTSKLSAAQKAFSWDLILAPCIGAATNDYLNFTTAIGTFTDTTIPVAVMQAIAPGNTAESRTATGCNVDAAAQTISCNTFDWQGRALTKMHLYGEAAVVASLHANATALFHNGTHAPIWRYDIGGHPTMWQAGYANSLIPNASACLARPWLALQWMVDQQSTEAKKAALRERIRKSYTLLRWDMMDNAEAVTNLANVQSLYAALESGGIEEIWLATTSSGVDPGTNSPATAAWFATKDRSAGGLLRATNHNTDFVDQSSDGVYCSTNGATFSEAQFALAQTEYESACRIITALGFELGNDGYGGGCPNVQDSNFMNNPSAKFCANNNLYPWLEESVLYPEGGSAVETSKTRRCYSQMWNGARTLTAINDLDAFNWTASGAQGVALTVGFAYAKAFVYSASLYIHATAAGSLAGYADDYTSQFLACPDIWKSGPWEECLDNLKQGVPALIYI